MADERVVFHFRIVIVILLLQKSTGCQDACSAVGLDNSSIIPDSSFTANSELRAEYGAKKARFSSDSCWEPNGNNGANHYLQIDLGKVFVICAVATKGNPVSRHSEWTKQYKISTSSDGSLWTTYSDNNNSPKLFPGNTDINTAVKNELTIPVLAKLIRFIPTKINNYKALRVEVYGIDSKDFSCKSLPVGVASVAKIPANSLTAASLYNASTPPSNGRLGYTSGSSWCAATSDSSPYLQVKMSSPYIICGVATQGDHKSDQWVQTYQIETSTDGSSFTDYKHNNVIKDFAGNTDSNTIVKNLLYEGTVSQYIRINAKSDFGTTSCMRTELYGVQQNTVCSKMSVGVPYSSLVPNHRFSASSYIHNGYLPSNARLRTTKAWEPKTDNVLTVNWLQIDLGSVVYVCAVATQGNAYNAIEYAKKYKLRISLDNVNWRFYQENSADKNFTGNTDRTTIVTNTLAVPTKTKFLRFYPTVFNGFAAMRVDVYGVPATCRSPFGVEKNGSVEDGKMTSSSQSDSSHAASFGRLYGDASWCSNTLSNTKYIEINLGKMVTLTGIATQGDHAMDKWVKTYTLKYSIDGNVWNDYRGNQSSAKIFQGNSDRTSIVVRWLIHPVTVRYVRVYPQSWNTAICMRIELFGCQCPSPPEIKALSNKILAAASSSYVDLECYVQEPLIQYIDWYSDGKDVTNLSGGITRTASSIKSMLRVNFTSADDVVNTYQCTNVACRKNFVCRAKYAKADSNADSIKDAEVLVNLEYPSAPSLSPVGSILSRSVVVRWSQPSLKASQASIQTYVIKYWNSGTTKTISVSHTAASRNISSLSVCTSYNVTIKAVSKLGEGPGSNTKTFKTDSEIPTVAPGGVQAEAKTSQSILVTWKVPSGVRCAPSGYKVIYNTSGGVSHKATVNVGQSTSHTLVGLDKWTEYSITIQVRNDKGYGPASSPVVKRTLEDTPEAAPQNFKGTVINSTSISLSWDSPPSNKRNGIIRGYRLWYCKTGHCSSPLAVKNYTGTSTVLYNLTMYTQYTFKVLAYTSVGDGPYTTNITRTLELPPSAPTNVRTTVIDPVGSTGPKVKIEWNPPSSPNGNIKGYKVSYGKTGDENTKSLNIQTFLFTFNVRGGLNYTIKVWAFNSYEGAKAVKSVTINDYEPPAPKVGDVSTITSAVGNITLWKISDINGKLDHILVYVHKVKDKKRIKRSSDSSKLTCKGIAKDAAELPPNTETFPLGDGKKYGNYTNVKLEEGKQYEVFQCGKTKNLYGGMVKIAEVKVPVGKDDKPSKPTSPPPTLVVSLVTVFLILIIGACAAVLFVIWRRHGRRERERSDNMKFQNIAEIAEMEETNDNATSRDVPTHNNDGFVSNGTPFSDDDNDADMYGIAETIRHQPIPANKFSQYVNEKNEALKGEFNLLSNGQLFPYDIAKDPNNKPKNRYQNIITYNHSRVVLEDTDDGSDYINASYIHGFDGTPRTYIATQGPKPLTVPDIWHMIWQENITTIVMLTNLIEAGKIKCHQYWPDHKEQYGQFTVNLHRSDILADYVVRIFIISKDGESGNRQVYHYQYISWPDKGVPQHATSVLGFRRKVKSQYMSSGATAPLLVHCSAGVGRTGAFLAIDAMMERVKKEKSVDIFNYVQLMRNNRSTMIQTDEQYLFVHLALQEAITCGNTEIPVLNLNIALMRLSKERPKDSQTGYELEWRRLAAISPKVTEENSEAGRLEQNIPRNRYTDTFPFDAGRVFLSQEQQNYINASFGDAYRERNAFIMAQAPMENTMTDFWHMIHQYKIGSIVMLNKLTEDQQTFPRYWPVQGSDMYEGIIVEVASSSTQGPLVITQCVITHPWEPKSPHNILHIQHTDWPEGGAPSDCQSVLEIVDKVQKSQQQSGNAPIVVHCSDGVGRSGTFCAVYSLLERVKSEQVMDVFQAIKVLRLGRPNAVTTLEQYKFCYRMVQIYLDSFNDYANFSEV